MASAALVEAFGVERFFAATASVDVLLANAEEAHALTGLDGEEAALALGRRYRVACVKLGRAGAVATFDGTVARACAAPLESGDTLGAGDTFAAAFLLALAGGAELGGALDRACEAGTAAIAAWLAHRSPPLS